MEKMLSEVCDIQYGYAFDSAKFSADQGIPLIRIRDVVRGFSETYTTEVCDQEYIVNDGDILIGMDGEFNIARWKGGKAYLNQRVCRLLPKDEVDAMYLYYFMPKALKAIEDKTPFVTVKHLSAKELNKIVVPIPIIEEQKEIANCLQRLDELISFRKQQLSKLDELVKSRFIELFGEINAPSKWEKKPWAELVTIQNGRDYKHIAVESGGYAVYGTGGEMARASDYLCPENTIIVGRKGTINNPLLVKEKFWNVDTAFGVIVGEQLHYQYFYGFCRMFDFSTLNKQAVLPSTTKADLLKIQIAVPPIELQREYTVFVEQIDKSKFEIQKSLEKLETLKKALMQKYFG